MANLTRRSTRKNKKSPEISRLMFFMQTSNLKSVDIEKETGISKRTIDNFIHSDLPIGAQLLRELHEKYRVSIDWLISGIGEMLISPSSTNEPKTDYQAVDKRTWRMQRFINEFMQTASDDEQAWLEVQLKFSLPPYRAFLERVKDE